MTSTSFAALDSFTSLPPCPSAGLAYRLALTPCVENAKLKDPAEIKKQLELGEHVKKGELAIAMSGCS